MQSYCRRVPYDILAPDYVESSTPLPPSTRQERHRYISQMEVITYTLHITIAREFLQELSSKGLWLYVAKLVDGAYTVVYQGLTTPNVTLSWEEGTSMVAVASGDGEIVTSSLVLSFDRASSSWAVSTPDERTRNSISPPNSTRDNPFESDTPTVTPGASPVKFKVWFDYKGSSAAMISHALGRAMEVDFTALKKTRHEISFVLDPTPVNGFWSHQA